MSQTISRPRTLTSKTIDVMSITDSGYTSRSGEDTSTMNPQENVSPQTPPARAIPIPGTNLKTFQKSGDPASIEHFEAVLPGIEAELKKAISAELQNRRRLNDRRSRGNVAICSRVIGTDETSAYLRLVILCSCHLEDIVRQVLALDWIQLHLNEPRYARPLEVYILLDPPKYTHAMLDIDACYPEQYTTTYKTYCGAPLILRMDKRSGKRARCHKLTLGGVVKAAYGQGDMKLFGMIAGHAVDELLEDMQEEAIAAEAEIPEQQDAFSLGTWLPVQGSLGKVILQKSLPGVAANYAKPSHDWCLVELDTPLDNLAIHSSAELANHASHEIRIAQRPIFQDDCSDPVLFLGAAGGARCGTLNSARARIWLEQSETFVDAYMLNLGDSSVLEGDSGGWVVHSTAPIMYGHAVATDAFGDAYVLPALDTFENIRDCLGAISLTLPTVHDFTIASSHLDRQSDSVPSLSSSTTVSDGDADPGVRYDALDLHTFGDAKKHPFASEDPSFVRYWEYQHVQDPSICNNSPADLFWNDCSDKDKTLSWELQTIEEFCRSVDRNIEGVRPIGDAQTLESAWVDDMEFGTNRRRTYPETHDAAQLRATLKAERFAHASLPNADRRLILIENLTPTSLQTLAATASKGQINILRGAVTKFITRESSLEMSLPSEGVSNFRLEFHLPYLSLRRSSTQARQKSTINPASVPCRSREFAHMRFNIRNDKYVIHDSSISIVIAGSDSTRWTVYAFSAPYDSASINDGSSDDENSSDKKKSIDDDSYANDNPFTDSAISSDPISKFTTVIWDPKNYFIHCLDLYSRLVLTEWNYLTYSMCSAIRTSRIEAREKVGQPGDTLRESIKLMRHVGEVRENLARTIRAWDNFSDYGNMLHFPDIIGGIHATGIVTSLHPVKQTFHEISGLHHKLGVYSDLLVEFAHTLNLQVHLENNELSRNTHRLIGQTNVISHDIRELNRKSTMAAVEHVDTAVTNSQTTRANVLIIWFTMPLVMVLQYFGIEKAIFPFERNPGNFCISVFVVFCSLPLMAYVLGMFTSWVSTSKKFLGLGRRKHDEDREKVIPAA